MDASTSNLKDKTSNTSSVNNVPTTKAINNSATSSPSLSTADESCSAPVMKSNDIDSSSTTAAKTRLDWTDHTEDLLASWGDVASCYKWLHERAFRKFYTINYWMSLFISIFSIITGSTSLGMQSLVPMDYVSLASKIVGGVNLITGIVTQIQANFR